MESCNYSGPEVDVFLKRSLNLYGALSLVQSVFKSEGKLSILREKSLKTFKPTLKIILTTKQ